MRTYCSGQGRASATGGAVAVLPRKLHIVAGIGYRSLTSSLPPKTPPQMRRGNYSSTQKSAVPK